MRPSLRRDDVPGGFGSAACDRRDPLEAGIASQRSEARVHREMRQEHAALLEAALQPGDRGFGVAEAEGRSREMGAPDVAPCRLALEGGADLDGLRGGAGLRQGPSASSEHDRIPTA
jgi:hypothetical protein